MLDDTTPQNLPATLRRLSDIVAEYDEKVAAIPSVIADFRASIAAANVASCIGGTYAGQIFYRGAPDLADATMRENLLQSAWRHVYNGLNLNQIAPASDRSRFETAFKAPAPFTLDNIRATFGKYITDPRAHILRGLAEAFSQLDPAFRSHDKMRIGVKGLPKRVILPNVTSPGYGGWGTDRLTDMLKAMAVHCGLPHPKHSQIARMLDDAKDGDGRIREITGPGGLNERWNDKLGDTIAGPMGDVWLRRFANGNGHLFFGPVMLDAVNRALAEYYGEVLPDCPEERPARAKSTEVSKDLAFYRTPAAVADELVSRLDLRDTPRILEPSCGDGALLDAIRRKVEKELRGYGAKTTGARVVGIEYDAGRAAEARAKGYAVQVANFLQVQPDPVFDYVVMNPPFVGKHYQKHVEHARKFLKPGGTLFAILPVTAVTDHGFVNPGRGWDRWKDLPVGSFSESGTNINTGIAVFGSTA
jgi:hypothetical protein